MKKTYFRSQKHGFSLIELLVVVAIIGILMAIIIVSLNSQKDVKDAESAALAAAARLREAQASALAGRQYIVDTVPCSYRVVWGSTQITTSYVYKDSGGSCTNVSTVNSLTLPSLAAFSGSGSVDFSLPHGNIASAQIVTIQKNAASRVVCVKTSGLIEVQNLAGNC